MTTTTSEALVWRPHAGPQTRFMSSWAFEALFGGSAGPGKTDCLLMESLRQINHPRYNAILFRRTFTQLEAADGLIPRSLRWFPAYGGSYNAGKHYWTFPSGAKIYFGHLQHENDKYDHQGAQYTYVGFDELTHFTKSQYMYLIGRCRADDNSGLRCYVRAASNPGGFGHEWVKERFVTKDIVNKPKYFALVGEVDTQVDKTYPGALSRAFYPSLMSDNPSVDPGYRNRILLNPDPTERAQLLDGDWDATSSAGRVYPEWSYLNIDEAADYNPDWPVYWGVDDGHAQGQGRGTISYHPRVFLLAQLTPTGGFNVFYEYFKTQELAEVSIDYVSSLPYKAPECVYVDSSALDLKLRLWHKGYQTIGATHKVSEGIKNVRRFILDGLGVRQLKVHPRCKELIYELGKYSFDEASTRSQVGEPVPLKIDDHGADALRYLLYGFRNANT